MNKIINEIKDSIYEAEGLLELLQLRPEKLTELYPLIEARMSEASAKLSKLRIEDAPTVPANVVQDTDNLGQINNLQQFDDLGEATKVAENAAVKPRVKTPPAFCLNDRYRFRRTIFAGSDAEFKATMEHLATLDSYTDAEELFLQDMGLNPEDRDVADFMAIIKEYFKA